MVAWWRFFSQATNLVRADTNSVADIFDREWSLDASAGWPERVSVMSGGGQAANSSFSLPVLSGDGRFVAFNSLAPLAGIPHLTNTAEGYIHDRLLGTTELVTVSLSGGAASKGGNVTRVSNDGRFVLFESMSADLVPNDTNARFDVFLRDRLLGTTERISTTPSGDQLLADSGSRSMSSDGQVILLLTSNIDGDAGPAVPKRLFAIDRQSGNFEEISAGFVFGLYENVSEADIDDSGRFVAFVSRGDAPGFPPSDDRQVYLYDRATNTTVGVTLHEDGTWLDSGGWFVAISGHGRFVSFVSSDPTLTRLAIPPNSAQAQRYDRVLQTTELATISLDGVLIKDEPEWTALSADGRTLAFSTTDYTFGPLDRNGFRDVIVRRFGSGITGDVNGDGWVDSADLAALIAAWGTTDQAPDIDGDGTIGARDLALLLGRWRER
ncbi:MAG: dockerin type I domain-containing protein [Phycisphaerae bacterium]|nr:dockerin type I domain-containing protein [Phycisphaerae bacterium]